MNQHPTKTIEQELDYDIIITPVITNQKFLIDRRCNSLTIINQGTTRITINEVLFLYPGTVGTNSGESFTFGGLRNELFSKNGRIDISFVNGMGVAVVIQKIYI